MDTDVIVVGAGPTGLMLACELAMRGVRVEVVEQQERPSGQSRGGGVQSRTAEVFDMRGLLDVITSRAVPREVEGGHFAMLPVPLDTRPWRTRLPGGVLVPQDRLEEVLEVRLGVLGVAVRRGVTVTGVLDDGAGVVAEIGGELRARYLVACDGGHSTVRRLLDVPFPGRSGTMAAVTADIELATAADTVAQTVGHISGHVRTGGDVWMMLHPLGDGVSRVVFGGPDQLRTARDAPVTEAEVDAALVAVHGPGTRLARLRWGTRFSDATRVLDHYRHGRVLFAGDAAHIHPPMGGQGLNLGVQDAVNLGWKLAAALRGRLDLLDTYEAERRPPALQVITATRAQRVLMAPGGAPDDDVSALREIVVDLLRTPDGNALMAGMLSGLSLRYDLGDADPLIGTRLPDLGLETADGPTRVFELLRSGRGLLLELDGDLDVAPPPDVDRVRARVLDSPVGTELAASAVLVRPDGYVCWAGGDGLREALGRWFGVAAVVS